MLQKYNRTWHNHETQPTRGIKRRSDEKQIMTKQSLTPHKYKFGLHRDSLPHLSNIKKRNKFIKNIWRKVRNGDLKPEQITSMVTIQAYYGLKKTHS